jgi:radical SAM protein (TIGR04043 family)
MAIDRGSVEAARETTAAGTATVGLYADLQAMGVSEADAPAGAPGRRGGAGPSDHRALSFGPATVMVPMRAPGRSPFRLRLLPSDGDRPQARALLLRESEPVAEVELPAAPHFYRLATADGVPYWKIALLHARRVLASTVMQSCVRYNDEAQACRFCAIGTSLKEGRTLARKTPAQLAEVAEAAVRLDGIEQMVLTTGTPATPDRGAAHLAACVAAIKRAVPSLPIQVQCEPPDDLGWLARLKEAGADTLGMHLEAVEPAVRAAVMPGKAELSLERYDQAFAAAVGLFGRGQVSTYLIAGLGDRPESLVAAAAHLVAMGVYPFLVPFVPIAGTPMADTAPPPAAMMDDLYRQVAALLRGAGLSSGDGKAGCAKCGACSALSSYEAAS